MVDHESIDSIHIGEDTEYWRWLWEWLIWFRY